MLVATIAAIMAAAGFVVASVTGLLRMILYSKETRRAVKARAESDEAVRDYYQERVKQARLQTKVFDWAFRKAKKGHEEVTNELLLQIFLLSKSGSIEPTISESPTVDVPVNIELPIDPPQIDPFRKAS